MSKFRFNWGWGIVVTMSLFVALMGYTVYLTFQNDYILESDTYYEDTLEYDKVMQAEVLGKTLFEDQFWKADTLGNIGLSLPMKVDSVHCLLIHPENSAFDRILNVLHQENKLLLRFEEIPNEGMLWRVELSAFIGANQALLRKRWKH